MQKFTPKRNTNVEGFQYRYPLTKEQITWLGDRLEMEKSGINGWYDRCIIKLDGGSVKEWVVPGEWIIQHKDGLLEIIAEDKFQNIYIPEPEPSNA